MPARVATGPFPTTLKGKSVFLHCRSKKHDAIIAKVERDEGSTTVILTFTGRLPTRPFLRGELASLEIRGDCSGFPYDHLLTIYPAKPKSSHPSFALNKPSRGYFLSSLPSSSPTTR